MILKSSTIFSREGFVDEFIDQIVLNCQQLLEHFLVDQQLLLDLLELALGLAQALTCEPEIMNVGRGANPLHDRAVAVAHREFIELGAKGIRAFANPNAVIFDIKHVLPKGQSDGRL